MVQPPRIELGSMALQTTAMTTSAKVACLVVDQGYDPCRSSPSDQSPGIIRPRRTPVLSTILKHTRLRYTTYFLRILMPAYLESYIWVTLLVCFNMVPVEW